MPYYLSTYRGGGTKADPFLPVGSEQPGWAAIDLRPDGGMTRAGGGLNACLLYLPTAPGDLRGLDVLADDARERVAVATLTTLLSKLGLAKVDATDFDRAILEIVTTPPANGWRPAKDRVYLGPLAAEGSRTAGPPVDLGGVLLCALGCHVWLAELGRWMPTLSGSAALASDAFTRANNANLGADWNVQAGCQAWKIVSNQAQPSAVSGNNVAEHYDGGVSWPNDQYSTATCASVGGSYNMASGTGLTVRAGINGHTLYTGFSCTGTGTTNTSALYKAVAGSYTQLGLTTTGGVLTAGELLYLEVQGTTLVYKKAGTTIFSGTTDSAIASGRPGIFISTDVNGTIAFDDWEGGDFAAVGGQPAAKRMGGIPGGSQIAPAGGGRAW